MKDFPLDSVSASSRRSASLALPLRPAIDRLQQNGITKVAFSRFDDPAVIPLWFGEGDLPTPGFICAAATEALDEGRTFYVHTRGHPALRSAIKAYLDRLYGIDVDPDRITVPGSAMLGVLIAAQIALGEGDHGIIVSPAWPNIDAVFRVTGCELSHVRQRLGNDRWRLDLGEVAAAVQANTKAIYVNSPCNPTGWMMPPEDQQQLLNLCRERGILLIADEVYHRTVFDTDPAPSFLQWADDEDPLIVVNGFSKAWAMTGWRLGWVVAPASLAEKWAALSECYNTGSTVFAQPGGIVALEQGEGFVRQLQAQYRRGRAIVDEVLGGHSLIRHSSPAGAYYAFPEIVGLKDSYAFAMDILAAKDVGVAPGYTFGPDNESHVRISFAQSHDRLEEGLNRLVAFVESKFG
ncbi:MAG: aminotransferase class I/II-fold pyridoxal phosphate-dependent enzyme [Gammaproteobacteria bacterium]|nr:aminotransferase class I/II-fold pyridoxal phosphate-dependent enzyme [Gammaproteobacteria bacterium]